MNELSKLIENEIADFFTGFGAPGEPDIQSGEAQRQLTERLLSLLTLRERAAPLAWTDEQELRDVNERGCGYLFTVNPITPHADPRRVIKLYAEAPAPVVVPEGLHPVTADLVVRFATALAEKLHKAEQKYGWSTDWMKSGWYNDCLQSLWEHIEKGDPRDVAAYCAFMWHHGWVTTDYDRNVQRCEVNEDLHREPYRLGLRTTWRNKNSIVMEGKIRG